MSCVMAMTTAFAFEESLKQHIYKIAGVHISGEVGFFQKWIVNTDSAVHRWQQ